MSKKQKVAKNPEQEANIQEEKKVAEIESGVVKTEDKNNKKQDVKQDKNAKKENKKKKEKKNKKGLIKKTKETASELKKVTWPSFGEVVKKTGIVIAFVVIFGLLVFGVDTLLGFLVSLLV